MPIGNGIGARAWWALCCTLLGAAHVDAVAEEASSALDAIVGQWDLRGTDVSLGIRPDGSVFHSRLGQGDIRHENVYFYTIEYRHTHLECHYEIKKYADNELSIVVSRQTDHQDCYLGEMRRAPGSSKPKAEGDKPKTDAESKAGTEKPSTAVGDKPAAQAGEATPPVQELTLKPADELKDCPSCPQLVVLPAGAFYMGSPTTEPGRRASEGPQHRVEFGKPFAVGRFPVTVGEFKAFVAATGYEPAAGCNAEIQEKWTLVPAASFKSPPGFLQDDTHPVVCVSWADAKAYASWLSKLNGKKYRLLSEAEREYAARGGTVAPYWWGSTITPQQANFDTRPRGRPEAREAKATKEAQASGAAKSKKRGISLAGEGADEAAQSFTEGGNAAPNWGTRPVSSFAANPFGLYNVHGNAAEWTEDCWSGNYSAASSDGHASTTGDCSRHVVRGGGWSYWPEDLRAAYRESAPADGRYFHIGFRVARDLER